MEKSFQIQMYHFFFCCFLAMRPGTVPRQKISRFAPVREHAFWRINVCIWYQKENKTLCWGNPSHIGYQMLHYILALISYGELIYRSVGGGEFGGKILMIFRKVSMPFSYLETQTCCKAEFDLLKMTINFVNGSSISGQVKLHTSKITYCTSKGQIIYLKNHH